MKLELLVSILGADDRERVYRAKELLAYKTGVCVKYVDKSGKEQEVFAKGNYKMVWKEAPKKKFLFFKQWWPCVGRREGSTAAVPMYNSSPDIPGEDYHALLAGHAFTEAYKGLKGKPTVPVWLVLILAVVIIGAGVFWFINRGGEETAPDDNQQELEEAIESGH